MYASSVRGVAAKRSPSFITSPPMRVYSKNFVRGANAPSALEARGAKRQAKVLLRYKESIAQR
jgi:hypothetical protein